ncbi:MAG: hypothetical protein AAF799_29080 [Myxococcota bacterium]
MVEGTEVVGKDESGRVRIVELDAPVPITERRLVEWSAGFQVPTVVRNAFTPPSFDASTFLPADRLLKADLGRVGEFRDFNGEFSWSKLWSSMNAGQDVYGSFGTGTPNIDEQTVDVIRRLKRQVLPADVYADDQNPGHIIFGSSTQRQTTTGWHNAIDANLLFQLHGRKGWYSIERLPESFVPVAISNFTYLVRRDREGASLAVEHDDDERELQDLAAQVVLEAGDMLINTPYSWHSVWIDGFSLSLSLRGDRADVMAWLAYRYFDGNIDDPMLATFGSLFDTVSYGASKRELAAEVTDFRGVARLARKRLQMFGGRIRSRLGLGEPYNPIIDSYSASDSSFQELRAMYLKRFERYRGA